MTVIIFRAMIIYLCVFVVIRFMGKRQVGEMQPFEFVITLIIADLACIPMSELSIPIFHGIVPILVLLIVHFLICFLARKFMFARYLLTGKPAILISSKGIHYKELQKLNMTLDDLMELVRGASVFSLSEIAYAILETNGNLCVVKKAESEPPTRGDLKVKVSQNGLPVNLVMDGCLMKDNLALTGLGNNFIEQAIFKANLKSIKDVLILTIDNVGNVFIQGKNKDCCLSYQIEFNGGDKW